MTAAPLKSIASPDLLTFPATIKRVILTGFMGAGKTSVGRIVAEMSGWEFLDLDAHLEARTGSSIPSLFSTHGEEHFRRLESTALANALAHDKVVLALGGGTPEQLTNRLLLEQTPGTYVIFLDAPFEVLFDRCMLQSFATPAHVRPLLASPEEAAARFASRRPIYRRLARGILSTADLSPADVAQQVIASILSA